MDEDTMMMVTMMLRKAFPLLQCKCLMFNIQSVYITSRVFSLCFFTERVCLYITNFIIQ